MPRLIWNIGLIYCRARQSCPACPPESAARSSASRWPPEEGSRPGRKADDARPWETNCKAIHIVSCAYMHTCIGICACLCMYVCVYVYIYICMCVCIFVHAYVGGVHNNMSSVYAHMCGYAYICIYMYIYTHAFRLLHFSSSSSSSSPQVILLIIYGCVCFGVRLFQSFQLS